MSYTIGRLLLEDPRSFPENVGQSIGTVGATAVPAARQAITTQVTLESFAPTGSLPADRARIRRQFRSMMNNMTYRLQGIYVNWSEDSELNGWVVPSTATINLEGSNVSTSYYTFDGVDLTLVGRQRTHRRGLSVYLKDRRLATTPRDYLKRIYSTNFSTLIPTAITWLPNSVTDVVGGVPASTASSGYGSASLQVITGLSDLSLVTFEQTEANMNKGDVVIYDRKGTTALLTTGPQTVWEEVYGPDYPLTASDVPVLDNSFTRVSYSGTNTPGFLIEWWTGSAWAELGKVIIERIGDATGYLNTLVSATVKEWSPERAVLQVVMRNSGDTHSREEVYITLQRGWNGPRFEVYGANVAAGTKPQLTIGYYGGTTTFDTAIKIDASDVPAISQTSTTFSAGTLGAATFTGENWIALVKANTPVVTMGVLQSAAIGRIENNSSAYGSARNGISVRSAAAAGYVSAHFGNSGTYQADTQMEAESMTLSSGTSSGADAGASGGNATSATRTSEADHVTRATWNTSARGTYRVFARVRNGSAGTLNIRAQTTATTGTTRTTTSTSYVWLDLGEIVSDGTTLQIRAWRSSAGTLWVDRIEAVKVLGRTVGPFDGCEDLGKAILYDSRVNPTIVTR